MVGEHPHRGAVRGEEVGARLHLGDARGLGLLHGAVDLQLRGRPLPVTGMVRVTSAVYSSSVSTPMSASSRLPGRDRAVVAPPVQRRGVRAGADDRGVADLVALEPGPPPERPLQPALAAQLGAGRPRSAAHGRRRRSRGRWPRTRAQPGELPLVLDQAQLVEHLGRARRRRCPAAARRPPASMPRSTAVGCRRQRAELAGQRARAAGCARPSTSCGVRRRAGRCRPRRAPCMRLVK